MRERDAIGWPRKVGQCGLLALTAGRDWQNSLTLSSFHTTIVTTLAQFTSRELIVPRLQTQDTAAVVGELCSALQREGRLKDLLPFYNAAMNQEYMSSSATPQGWALVHARVKGLASTCFALGRSDGPLEWLGPAKLRVRLVFLFAVPKTDATTYLALISGLARLAQDTARMEGLINASDGDAILEILAQVPLRQAHSTASSA